MTDSVPTKETRTFKNSKRHLMGNPKNIRSFSSTPALERGLAKMKATLRISVSEIIRRAIHAYLKKIQ
jgi:hypothetical protein